MLRSHGTRMCGCALLTLIIAVVAGSAHAGNPVPLAGSDWSLLGTASDKLKKVGKSKREGVPANANFGPNATLGLATDEWSLFVDDTDDSPLTLHGTYSESKPGKARFAVDLDDLAMQLTSLLQDLTDQLPPGVVLSVEVDAGKLKAKAAAKNGVETLKLKFSAKARVLFSGNGFDESLKLQIGYSGRGGLED